MALSERTVNRHNIKRAEVFAANGLNTLDVQYAHPNFEGYGHGTCTLCGKQHLKWLFSIKFDVPSGLVALAKVFTDITRDKEVTLQPVGSKCINDWLDAVPETAEKLEVLKRWGTEMKRCKQAMVAKVVEDLCKQAGFESPQEAYDAYIGLSYDSRYKLKRKQYRRLSNNAYGIKHMRSSRGTVKNWLADLTEALGYESQLYCPRQQQLNPAIVSVKVPKPLSDDEKLLERGRAAWANRSVLTSYHLSAFVSMGKQAEKKGGFISSSQRRFYADLLKRLEG